MYGLGVEDLRSGEVGSGASRALASGGCPAHPQARHLKYNKKQILWILCFIGIVRGFPFRGPLVVGLCVLIQPYLATCLYKKG